MGVTSRCLPICFHTLKAACKDSGAPVHPRVFQGTSGKRTVLGMWPECQVLPSRGRVLDRMPSASVYSCVKGHVLRLS